MADSKVFNISNLEEELSVRSECSKSEKKKVEPGTSFEVFRNNTTAVEVIVKEVPQKSKKQLPADDLNLNDENLKMKALEETNEVLMNKLIKCNIHLKKTTSRYNSIFAELKKRADTAYTQQLDAQERCLNLQFENEKLKVLLHAKTNLVVKLKQELINLKKAIKFVIKNISVVPHVSQVSLHSDSEYEVFEKDLTKDCNIKYLGSFYDGTLTINTPNLSKI
ncbi:uncharacterized protein LOC128677062 [Plodia interpunctella]|uniref:uncharacterized protein LOC128677062 n=1 Tax=Plodia interpunctella TaxID=58824 RepID=UPI00236759AF|nr:uncharacterized protein LOC128677062 [Plodia interpunctella]